MVLGSGKRLFAAAPANFKLKSFVLGEDLAGIVMPAGSLRGLHLVVANIATARAELAGRGVAMGPFRI